MGGGAGSRDLVPKRDSMIPRSGCTFFKTPFPGWSGSPEKCATTRTESLQCQVSHAEGGIRESGDRGWNRRSQSDQVDGSCPIPNPFRSTRRGDPIAEAHRIPMSLW